MSVLIKGVKMPKSCCECPMETDGSWCVIKCDFIVNTDKRLPDCPLVEVPKHGRLIDANELEKFELPATLFPKGRESNFDVWTHAVSIGDIKNAPTVIEAEVES